MAGSGPATPPSDILSQARPAERWELCCSESPPTWAVAKSQGFSAAAPADPGDPRPKGEEACLPKSVLLGGTEFGVDKDVLAEPEC